MENISIEALVKDIENTPRKLEGLKDVLKTPKIADQNPQKIVYDVYREVDLVNTLRYDITIMHPEMLGSEFCKTYGHSHEYLEVMEVLEGKALWLLQKHDQNNPEIIKEVYLVSANKGEKAIIPSDFGSISINPTKEKAVLSNWMCTESISSYELNKKFQGMCYYILKNKNGEIIYEKNPNYKEVPSLIELKPKELPEYGITFDKPLLSLKETPEKLEFLKDPEKYKNILTIDKCYEETRK